MTDRGQALRIHVNGTSPYGFRLVRSNQGEAVVTKLRPKSKAATAGLLDGDVIAAVNGYNCNEISLDRVMSLIEHAGHYIEIDVWRSRDNSYRSNTAVKRSRDWDCYDSAPASPSFDLLASSYQFDRISSPHYYTDADDDGGDWGYLVGGADTPGPPRWPEDIDAISALGVDNRSNRDVPGLRWNRDRSVTMSVNLFQEKENAQPVVKHRNEAFIVINSPCPQRKETSVWKPSLATRGHSTSYDEVASDGDWSSREVPSRDTGRATSSENAILDLSAQYDPLPPEIVKIITAGSEADILLEDLFPAKKTFADSSFYNDSKHSYPTTEEQIKMAKQVALSLESPINQDTRGHRMFMKRKEKLASDDMDDNVTTSVGDANQRSGDLYYNPTPWNSVRPWEPMKQTSSTETHHSDPSSYSNRAYSAASPIPSKFDENSSKAMSADEFERMRLFDQKTTHDILPPQVCFSLANDLRNSNSRGGKMFAKRRAKADQWTTENHVQDTTNEMKTNSNAAINKQRTPPMATSKLIWQQDDALPWDFERESRRGRITPWDAVVEYGDVAPAFEHLNEVKFAKPLTTTTGMTSASRLNKPIVQGGHATSAANYIEPFVSSAAVEDWLTLKQTGIGHDKINAHKPVNFSSIAGF